MKYVSWWVRPSTDTIHSPAYEDGTESEFRNVGNYNSDAGELPKQEQIISLNVVHNYRLY